MLLKLVLMSQSAAQNAHSWIRAWPTHASDRLIPCMEVAKGQEKGHQAFIQSSSFQVFSLLKWKDGAFIVESL